MGWAMGVDKGWCGGGIDADFCVGVRDTGKVPMQAQ